MTALFSRGTVLGEDFEKMSKSGQCHRPGRPGSMVLIPSGLHDVHGPWELGGPWTALESAGSTVSPNLAHSYRRAFGSKPEIEPEDFRRLHQTISKVTEDMEQFKFNTMVSALIDSATISANTRGKSVKRFVAAGH